MRSVYSPKLGKLFSRQDEILRQGKVLIDELNEIHQDARLLSSTLDNISPDVDAGITKQESVQCDEIRNKLGEINDKISEHRTSFRSMGLPACSHNSSFENSFLVAEAFRKLHKLGFPELGPVFMFRSLVGRVHHQWRVFPWITGANAEAFSHLDSAETTISHVKNNLQGTAESLQALSKIGSAGRLLEDYRKELAHGKRYIKLLLYLATGWFPTNQNKTNLSTSIDTAVDHINEIQGLRNQDSLGVYLSDRSVFQERELHVSETFLATSFELLLTEFRRFYGLWSSVEIRVENKQTGNQQGNQPSYYLKILGFSKETFTDAHPDGNKNTWYRNLARYCANLCFGSELAVSISDQENQLKYQLTISSGNLPG